METSSKQNEIYDFDKCNVLGEKIHSQWTHKLKSTNIKRSYDVQNICKRQMWPHMWSLGFLR